MDEINYKNDDFMSQNENNYRPFLQALSLDECKRKSRTDSSCNSIDSNSQEFNNIIECLLCEQKFDLNNISKKEYLAHLIVKHKLVISDVDNIAEFSKLVYQLYF